MVALALAAPLDAAPEPLDIAPDPDVSPPPPRKAAGEVCEPGQCARAQPNGHAAHAHRGVREIGRPRHRTNRHQAVAREPLAAFELHVEDVTSLKHEEAVGPRGDGRSFPRHVDGLDEDTIRVGGDRMGRGSL